MTGNFDSHTMRLNIKGSAKGKEMKWITAILLFLIVSLAAGPLTAQEEDPQPRNCKTRAEIRNTHRLEYRAADGSYRGCQIRSDFYFQIKKMGRGSPKKNIEICEEGDPRYTPKIGESYEICP